MSLSLVDIFMCFPYMSVLDNITHVASSVLTISTLLMLLIPKSRKWLRNKILSEEKEREKEESLLDSEKRVECLEKKQEMFDSIALMLLHDRLFQSCLLNIDRNYTTIPDLENIDNIYELYRLNGGNGTGKRLYEAVHKLELKGKGYKF